MRYFVTFLTSLLLLALATPTLAEAPVPVTAEEALTANAAAMAGSINDALVKVGEWMEATENFAVTQTPLLIQEILFYETTWLLFWTTIAASGISWGIFSYYWSHRNAKTRLERIKEHTNLLKREKTSRGENTRDTEDYVFSFAHYAVPVSGMLTFVLGTVILLISIPQLVKVLFAPRLFLVEYFKVLAG